MKEQALFNRIALLAVALVLIGGFFALYAANSHPTSTATAPTATGPSYLYLTIGFSPTNGLDEYFPGNFTIAAHTPIVLTIANYDDGANLVAPAYEQVSGVIGGTATVWSTPSANPAHYASLANPGISHTFTVALPSGQLNVPIPMADGSGLPVTVQVTVELNSTGVFTWYCMAPCDDGSMAMPGMMTGSVTVI